MPIKEITLFLLGVGLGSGITYLAVKKHFEILTDEEVASVREYYKNKEVAVENEENETDLSGNDEKTVKNEGKSAKNEPNYKEIIEKLNYGEYSKKNKPVEEEEEKPVKNAHIMVLSEDEYIGDMRYDKRSFTYFETDGVFIDEDGDVVVDGTELIGDENLDRFGEYEEDHLFIRNTQSEEDYAVLIAREAYAESDYYYRDHEDE